MNRWKTLVAWLRSLRAGRCEFVSAASGGRCRLPRGHDGSHVMWLHRWL